MTASTARVPCTVITGFLGAGKTTLIRHILENAGGKRLALIVNEFGDVGVDGEILKGCGIVGMENGPDMGGAIESQRIVVRTPITSG